MDETDPLHGQTGPAARDTVRLLACDMAAADPLAAAACFHTHYLPRIERLVKGASVLILRFDHAEEKPHRWRQQTIADLARRYAPVRINGVAPARASSSPDRLTPTISFACRNAALTGQLILVD
ncbi:hypothetical protein RM533_03490 [Croceicoccus sp. F390]|uniref:Short chain dehydrogenase-like proteobacteria domain-containing protein n=1 Tax=Croceicoccus esteveae TaxID=3075597 RepID=A0ABU2ZF71_9SPHN|nr:hypothetical protein [Croceicoccus sp. F390]MDT0575245.1 hypothetical protein [Croceicoccus sp. F390]